MKTIRRDRLMRLAKAGRLVSQGIYSFDDCLGADRDSRELPVRFIASREEWRDGYCNLRESDFKSEVGMAYYTDEAKGVVHLKVHSNNSVELRILKDGEQAPAPVIRRK